MKFLFCHDASGRLLLGHAVDGTESVHKRGALDRDHFPIFEHFSEEADRCPVIPVTVDRHEHRMIPDIEIGVAGRKSGTRAVEKPSGHRDLDQDELSPVLIYGPF